MFPKEAIAPYYLKDVTASIGPMGAELEILEF